MCLIDDVEVLMDEYWNWMRDNTAIRPIGDDAVEINTPFMDRHNDGIQIYAIKSGDRIRLTDDGHTIMDLEQNGCPMDTGRRKRILETILNVNGVSESDDGSLYVDARPDDPLSFASKKNDLLNAIMRVSDMHVLASPRSRSMFQSDVGDWLGSRSVPGVRDVRFTGRSGVSLTVDFTISKRITDAPTLLQSITSPDVQSMARMVFMREELRHVTPRVCAIIDDRDLSQSRRDDIGMIAEEYGIPLLSWTSRDEDFGTLGIGTAPVPY